MRISDDREGRALGVARQEADCRDLATQKHWPIADLYIDNDVSASKAKPRPEYNRLLEDVRAGRIDAVVVWDVDRLVRKPSELEEFIDLTAAYSVHLASVGGEIDLATPQGRLTARIKGSVARHETEQQQRRILAKVDELVANGLPHVGGGHRPFGYTKDRMHIVEDEAEIIREGARRLLAGESKSSIIHDWNARGIHTTTGGQWTIPTLTYLFTRGRNAGLVERHREIVGPAKWPAIIDIDTHNQLRQKFTWNKTERSPARRLLLSGLLYCGRCGTRMKGQKAHNGKPIYSCPAKVQGGCGGVAIRRLPTDTLVTGLVLQRIAQLDEADLGPDDTPDPRLAKIHELQEEVDTQYRKLEKLQLAFAEEDDPDAFEFRDTTKLIKERIAVAKAQITRETSKLGIRIDDPGAVVANWEDEELTPQHRKREIIAAYIEKITIAPAPKPTSVFNPDRVVGGIVWR